MIDIVVRFSRSGDLRAGVIWIKESDGVLSPGNRLRIINHSGGVRGEAEVEAVERFIDLEPKGRGRRLDEVFQKVTLVRGEDGWRI